MNLLLAVLVLGFGDPESATELPRSLSSFESAPAGILAVEPARDDDKTRGWWIGPRVGYIEAADADDGTWLIGAQVRWHVLNILAIEASIDFHKEEYADGDVDVFTIPVQLSAIVYLPVSWAIRPYGIAGIGWYFSKVDFGGGINEDDDTTSELGVHLGIGAEWELNPGLSLNFDFRYLFLDEPSSVGNADFDSIMLTIGLNFKLGS